MSGQTEDTVLEEVKAAEKKAEESKLSDEAKAATKKALDAGKAAAGEPTEAKVKAYQDAVDDFNHAFALTDANGNSTMPKNEGEALANLIYQALIALMTPLRMGASKFGLGEKMDQQMDALKSKLNGEEKPVVSVTPGAEPAAEATPAGGSSPEHAIETDIQEVMPDEEDSLISGFTDDELNETLENIDLTDEIGDIPDPGTLEATPPTIPSPAVVEPDDDILDTASPTVTPMATAAQENAQLDPVVNSSVGNLKNLKTLLENDSNKDRWNVKHVKDTKDALGVRLTLGDNNNAIYARENAQGGLTYSLKKGMKDSDKESAINSACQMSVDLAGPGATITISSKLSDKQKEAAYNAIQAAMSKPENAGKGLKVEGYTPPAPTNQDAVRVRPNS